MKTIFILTSALISLSANNGFATQNLAATGNLKWTGYKVQKVGDSHTGDLRIPSGTVQVDGDKILGGEFMIDMNSLKYKNKKLENHLKSADFFDVENFKESKFVIKSAEALPQPGPNGETHKIIGDLTIRGKTNPIELMAVVKNDKSGWTANAKTTIPDRTKFDINYNSPALFGLAKLADKAIADEIKIDLSLTAKPTRTQK